MWVWVGVAAAVLIVAALLYSSSSGGGGLALLLRGGKVTVPLVVGQPQAQAESLITGSGLRVGQVSEVDTLAVPPGTVVQQSPAPDTKAKADSPVDIGVSAVPQVQVPDVTGKTESAASETLAEQGLRIGTISYVYDPDVDAGDITAQDPSPTTVVAVGSAVSHHDIEGREAGCCPQRCRPCRKRCRVHPRGRRLQVDEQEDDEHQRPRRRRDQSVPGGRRGRHGRQHGDDHRLDREPAPAEPAAPAEPTTPATESAAPPAEPAAPAPACDTRDPAGRQALDEAGARAGLQYPTSSACA